MAEESSLVAYIAGVCGLIAPFAMFFAVLIASLMSPGYNNVTQYVSDLGSGSGPAPAVMDLVGFGVTGLLIAITALGLHFDVRDGRISREVLVVALFASGAAVLLTGAFLYGSQGDLHILVTSIFGLGLGLSALIGAYVFFRDPNWKKLWVLSLIVALAALAIFALLIGDLVSGYIGLFQRLGIAAVLLWVGVVGFWMARRN